MLAFSSKCENDTIYLQVSFQTPLKYVLFCPSYVIKDKKEDLGHRGPLRNKRHKTSTVKPGLMATSLLRPLFLAAWHSRTIRSPVNKANFFGPLVTVLTGFHYTAILTATEHKGSWRFDKTDTF